MNSFGAMIDRSVIDLTLCVSCPLLLWLVMRLEYGSSRACPWSGSPAQYLIRALLEGACRHIP